MVRAMIYVELLPSNSIGLISGNTFSRNSALIGANALEVRRREENAMSNLGKCLGGIQLVDN